MNAKILVALVVVALTICSLEIALYMRIDDNTVQTQRVADDFKCFDAVGDILNSRRRNKP